MKQILIAILVLLLIPLFASAEFIEKSDSNRIMESDSLYWADPYKARNMIAYMASDNIEKIAITLTPNYGITSRSAADWFVMQAAIAAGKNVWLYKIPGEPNGWYCIAVGQDPPTEN